MKIMDHAAQNIKQRLASNFYSCLSPPPCQDKEHEPDRTNNVPLQPIKKEKTIFFKILDMKDEATQKIWTDQPGRFPKKSSKGCQYMMVLTESESNAILVEAMKNRTSGEMIRTYQVLID
jgi:hypothetical protein